MFNPSCCESSGSKLSIFSNDSEDPKMGVKHPKWMVKIMENPIKMDDFGGFSHYFWVDTHILYLKPGDDPSRRDL